MASVRKNLLYDTVLPRVELASWPLAMIGLSLKYLLVEASNSMLVVGLGNLACIYYLQTFAPNVKETDDAFISQYTPVNVSTQQNFIQFTLTKIAGIASAVTLIGILFKLLFWKGSATMLLVGILSLLLVLAGQLTARYLSRRVVLIIGLGIFAWVVPTETLIQTFYRDDSALVEEMIFQHHHPNDKAASTEVLRLLHARRNR